MNVQREWSTTLWRICVALNPSSAMLPFDPREGWYCPVRVSH